MGVFLSEQICRNTFFSVFLHFYESLLNMKKTPVSSLFMKDCFADAVIRLLEENRLDEIQVKQICEVSGYHRASWFRSFHSKHEAVTYKMVRLWQNWSEEHGLTVRDEFTLDNAEAFFCYNYEIRDITSLLYRRGLMDDVCASFTAILYSKYREDRYKRYRAALFSYALFGVLQEWISHDFNEPPTVMAHFISETFRQL